MTSPSDPRVDACVEILCAKGCRQVRRDIAALEAGELIAEVAYLTTEQRRLLLAELKQIMAVYGDVCRVD